MSDASVVKRRGMVKDLVNELKREGATITHAALPGFEQPYKIGNYVPAVIAKFAKKGMGAIGIVKMGGTELEGGPARLEIKYLATRISQKTSRMVPVYIAVPRDHHNNLLRVLKEVGLADKDHIRTRAY